jgi:hypothetical protein
MSKEQNIIKENPTKNDFIRRWFEATIRHLKRRHERHYRDNYFHLWADLLLLGTLIGSLVIAIILFFWQPTPNFLFTIKQSSDNIKSNTIEKFVIDYKNQEADEVNNVVFKLGFPHYFVLKEIGQNGLYNDKDKVFTLGNLKKGASGQIIISGLVRGPINDHQLISAYLTYDYHGFTKEYLLGFNYVLNNSALGLKVKLADKVYDEIKTPASLELTNSSTEVLDNIFVAPNTEAWNVYSEDPTWVDNNFKIDHLNPGETKTLNFLLTNKAGLGERDFSIKVNQLIDDNLNEQTSFDQKITISRPSLLVSFKPTINNSSLPGKLTGNIIIKNQEDTDIKNLSLVISSSNDRVSFSNFSSTNVSVSSSGLISVPNLGANEEKTIFLNVDITRKEVAVNESFYPLITSSYTFNNENFTYTSAAALIKVATNISLHSAAYYYSLQGDQLGIGPLPPQIDIPTTYWVIWEINNLGNDVSNLSMTAKLPLNIAWGEQEVVGSGDLTYNPANRTIAWNVKDISKNGGNYRANFAITLLPSSLDIGTSPTLLTNQGFIAKDSFTDQNISNNLANITTNISEDPLAKGKDKVIPQE